MPEQERANATPAPETAEAPQGFRLDVSADRLTLVLQLTTPEPPAPFDEFISAVCAEMVKLGITGAEAMAKAAQRITEANAQGKPLSGIAIAEGTPPGPSQDGIIEWQDDFFKKGFELDPETGVVDYRRRAAKLNVRAQQHLATVRPPIEGKPGRDVFGEAIPAVKPNPARIHPGGNVRYDSATESFFAEKDGRIRFADGVLAVDDVYTVPGNVDLKTGHIKHPGTVIIQGNVESESKVEADGDVEVYGFVENAEIRTGGNLSVHGGISGGDACVVQVGGMIQAKFIENAKVQCGGDVLVEREVNLCAVQTRGAVILAQGRIIGGEIRALGGIDCEQIGSDAYLRTVLVAGEDCALREKVTPIESELQRLRENLSKIAEKLVPLKSRIKNLPPKLRELVTVLLDEGNKIREEIERCERELEGVYNESRSRAKKEIVIRKRILPDAFFQIPPLSLLVKEEVEGPVKVAFHEGELHLLKTRVRR